MPKHDPRGHRSGGAADRGQGDRGRSLRALLSQSRIDRELVADFMMLFARFEYAVRKAGYVRKGRGDVPVTKWDEFADKLEGHSLQTLNAPVRAAFDYLRDHPPLRQVCRTDGRLEWAASAACGHSVGSVLTVVRTVRNNLFHGGKEVPRLTERDGALVRHAVTVIESVVRADVEVERAFLELPPE